MTTYTAFLRGINVGGHKRVAMAELRDIITRAGFKDVRSYINSGNVAFAGRTQGTSQVQQKLERALKDELGMEITVIVRTAAELTTLIANNPYEADATKPDARVHVTLLSEAPTATKVKQLQRDTEDELQVIGREAYLRCVRYGETVYANAFLEKQLGVRATTRTLDTLRAVARLAGAA